MTYKYVLNAVELAVRIEEHNYLIRKVLAARHKLGIVCAIENVKAQIGALRQAKRARWYLISHGCDSIRITQFNTRRVQ